MGNSSRTSSEILPTNEKIPSHVAAPHVDWRDMGEREHFVQFYEHDEFLIDAVTGFIGAAIEAGESAIFIGTPAHLNAIQARLMQRNIDVQAATAREQCVWLDAAETLDEFMIDGELDPVRFNQVIGEVVQRALRNNRRLRAFGEMVALLWERGDKRVAVRLEELWNDLAKTYSFALFCAYPLDSFNDHIDGVPFADICKCHTRVIPAESYGALPNADQRLRAVSRLQQKAQSLETEILHRREVERALSRRECELLDFVENASEGLHRVAANGIILWANRAELNLLGYQAEEYIGHHIADFHADLDVINGMLSNLQSGQALFDSPARMRCKDGTIKYVEVNSSGYFEDGKLVYTRCFTRDVTARHEAEEQQIRLFESEREARAEAERVSRMKDEFLATLSHELRTPLNAIYGWTQIVKKSPADAKTVAEGMEVIDRNVRAQTQLIEDLLDMNRIVSGKVRLDIQRIDLIPVLQAAIESAALAAKAKGIEVKQFLDPLAGPVSGDPGRLQQVVWNLLNNAVKFTPEGGKIQVLLERVNSHLEISVSDDGAGIKPDFLPHVFERFRQADASITRKHGGLGLGLSIVKQLVELHGGNVRAKSAGEGKGATFIVALPRLAIKESEVLQQYSALAHDPALDCSGINLTGVKILIVDDEADARHLLSRLLRDFGAEVITAGSAPEAIDFLKKHHPNVMVSDIGMPGMDGFELIRAIRAMRPDPASQVAAIAVTALARSEDRTRALLAGYQLHLTKPMESLELIVSIASLTKRIGMHK
jgi:PAS domain S-box-containing protein